MERYLVGKPTSVGFATGAVAGLATVTPAAGFIAPLSALLFGVAAALLCYPMIQVVKQRWRIDDSLDVFAVHGIGGMAGSVLLAILHGAQPWRPGLCRWHGHGIAAPRADRRGWAWWLCGRQR